MNYQIKTFSLISGALVLGGVIYSLQGCQTEEPVKDPAWVADSKNSNTSQPQPMSAPLATPAATPAEAVTASAPATPATEKRAEAAKQGRQEVAVVEPEAVRRRIEIIEGARTKSVDFYREDLARASDRASASGVSDAASRSAEPSVLIAEASEVLPFSSQQALDRAELALELIKQQPEPQDAKLKKQYLDTKLAALEIRAKASDRLASNRDPNKVDAAETAYNEYLAVESDPSKVAVAQRDLAEMLYRSGRWEKAKVAYSRVLSRNPKNTEALARLSGIMRAIAQEQESAGQITEAQTSSDAADAYSEQLREVEDRRTIRSTSGSINRERNAVKTMKPPVADRAIGTPAADAKRPESKNVRAKPD